MKICWDELERINVSKLGNLRIANVVYIEIESCKRCGNSYLTPKNKSSLFCGFSCARSGKNNPQYGKTRSIETRKKISENLPDFTGFLNPNYKGGIYTAGLAVYDTYKNKLNAYEDIRRQKGTEVLEVKCVYCGQWFAPTYESVGKRITALNNLNKGECRLYCSENCKLACPTYGMHKYPKGFKHTTSREVDPYLRQMVFELDNWECQICGASGINVTLHCHHILGYAQNKMFANDVNNCITLCKHCHKMIHSRIGCRYVDLQCKKAE